MPIRTPGRFSRVVARSVAVALALALTGSAAAAQLTVFEDDAAALTLSGYVRSLTGLYDRGYRVPGLESTSGFHGEVARVKWRLQSGRYTLDVHNRLQVRVSSGEGEGPAVGFGVTAVPARTVDLSTDFIARDGLRAWHDLDRLSLSIHTPLADVTLGRQPITWGTSALFPVADLWAAFSPFELDTEEKPGIDAVRALFYPADGVEMDAVVADRGSFDHLSAGLRATWGLAGADVWVGAGRFWDRVLGMGGITVLLEETRLRAEAALPLDLARAFHEPRATLGFDWIRGRLSLTGEAHYNGAGAARTDDYVARAGEPDFQRGETYFLGRYYLGGAGSWAPDEEGRLRLALSALLNPGDGSAALTPVLDFDLGPATSLSLGAMASFGETPVLALPPRLRSEFGAYGNLLFTRVSVYF